MNFILKKIEDGVAELSGKNITGDAVMEMVKYIGKYEPTAEVESPWVSGYLGKNEIGALLDEGDTLDILTQNLDKEKQYDYYFGSDLILTISESEIQI